MASNNDSDLLREAGCWAGDEESEDPCGGCGAVDLDECTCGVKDGE